MQKLIEGVKLIKEVAKSDSILSVNFNKVLNTDTLKYRIVPSVHIRNEDFKEIVADLNIAPCYVELTERDSEFSIELELYHEGVYFFTVMDEHTFVAEFEEWIYDEPNIDEEFLTETSPMPENERLMKAAGHKMHDFM